MVLSAEELGLDGQGARSHRRQAGTEGRNDDRNPRITGVGERDPQLRDSEQRFRQRGPQTDKKKNPGAGTDDLRDGVNLRSCAKVPSRVWTRIRSPGCEQPGCLKTHEVIQGEVAASLVISDARHVVTRSMPRISVMNDCARAGGNCAGCSPWIASSIRFKSS